MNWMIRQDYDHYARYENIAWYEDGKVRIWIEVYPTSIEFVTCTRHER